MADGSSLISILKLSKQAHRALANAGYTQLEQLAKRTEGEIAHLHGMGPRALEEIRVALAERKLSFNRHA